MNIKSLMLAAAASTAVASGAQAADLPVAPEPVDYVRVCDAYGAGFFYIPGTETCLRVSGGVRADYRFHDYSGTGGNAWDQDADNSTGFRARAYVRHDSRTNTEYGLLRTYSDLWFTHQNNADGFLIWNAFIQWGGFTFGKAGSFYDGYNGANWGAQMGAGMDVNVPPTLVGYTAAFGNGLSAGISLEEDGQRRLWAGAAGAAWTTGTSVYGGHRIPDVVANLRVSQGWGSAGIYAVARQVLTAGALENPMGYAIAGDVQFNLPMISSGTSIGIRAAYGSGASGYVNRNLTVDSVNTVGTNMDNATAWGVLAGLSHQFTPTVATGITGFYASQDAFGSADDLKIWGLQGQVSWSPVAGLTTGVEVEYLNRDFSAAANAANSAAGDNLVTTIRVQRMF